MANIQLLLDKMTSVDKDLRYMACSDLIPELQKPELKFNERVEQKLVQQLLKLLEDVNGEVQTMAVKCLPLVVNKVSPDQVDRISMALMDKMGSPSEQLRDVCIIGIKSIFVCVAPDSQAAFLVCRRITGPLLQKLDQEDVTSVSEALDVFNEMLGPFGTLIAAEHQTLSAKLTTLLRHKRQSVRKRAISCLAALHSISAPALSSAFLASTIANLGKKQSRADTRTDLQCLTSLLTRAPDRARAGAEQIAAACLPSASVTDDDELREAALQCLEATLRLGQPALVPMLPKIIENSLSQLSYDPNYDADVEEMDQDEEEDDGDMSGDDDLSWKIRKAGATCLTAMVSAYPSLLLQFFDSVASPLLGRFKEREESARAEIIAAFTALVSQSARFHGDVEVESQSLRRLTDLAAPMVASIAKPLQDKSTKSRQAALALLREYVTVCPSGLSGCTTALLPLVSKCISDKQLSSGVKIEAISLLVLIVRSLPPSALQSDLISLCKTAIAGTADSFKIVAESLNLISVLVYSLRPSLGAPLSPELIPSATSLYDTAVAIFCGPSTDQDVREKATLCVAHLIAVLGEEHTLARKPCLPTLLARLQNEVTRTVATKALTIIAASPLRIEITSILPDCLTLLATFLAKNSRALRLQALQALMVLIGSWDDRSVLELCGLLRLSLAESTDASQKRRRVTARSENFSDPAAFESLLRALTPLISAADMQASQIALRVAAAIAHCSPPAVSAAAEPAALLPAVLNLCKSGMMQNNVLEALLVFLRAVVAVNAPGLDFAALLKHLTAAAHDSAEPLPRPAFATLGACVAATAHAAGRLQETAAALTADLQKPTVPDAVRLFSLAALGELGKQVDLSGNPAVLQAILEQFSCDSDDARNAAATALGLVCTGNLATYVPFIADLMAAQPERQYFLLNALKELITACVSGNMITVLAPFADKLWALLVAAADSSSEGVRASVGDCIGKLSLVALDKYLPDIVSRLSSPSAFVRASLIIAIKVAVCQAEPSPALAAALQAALGSLRDADLTVRREALIAFNSTAHNKPALLVPLLPESLPLVLEGTRVRPELVRVVEMGPFKHNVDDGLDSRKTAYECLLSLLKSCRNALDVSLLIDRCLQGLSDQYDVQMLAFLLAARLSALFPEEVVRRLDEFGAAFQPIMTAQAKSNAVQQEIDKIEELKRNALKAVLALSRLPGAEKSAKLTALMTSINETPALVRRLKAMQDSEATAMEF